MVWYSLSRFHIIYIAEYLWTWKILCKYNLILIENEIMHRKLFPFYRFIHLWYNICETLIGICMTQLKVFQWKAPNHALIHQKSKFYIYIRFSWSREYFCTRLNSLSLYHLQTLCVCMCVYVFKLVCVYR